MTGFYRTFYIIIIQFDRRIHVFLNILNFICYIYITKVLKTFDGFLQ